ncbi:hypothetical protein [Levilactobacillus fujinensis]|uniref:Uncharacterized protein n=1 Tax=Levilactobacillus fujinensis TaxID=2486024 RepID=A0ABW1TJ78_9LACO|nr:hypothetical protein [Levilactobacillus fujinensis]
MQNQDLTINDLDEHAQQTALTDFTKFYLRHYKTNDLEILSQYKVDYAMNDINMYLYANNNFHPDELVAGVLALKHDLFVSILSTMDIAFNENGSLKDTTWEGWYQQEYAKVVDGK